MNSVIIKSCCSMPFQNFLSIPKPAEARRPDLPPAPKPLNAAACPGPCSGWLCLT